MLVNRASTLSHLVSVPICRSNWYRDSFVADPPVDAGLSSAPTQDYIVQIGLRTQTPSLRADLGPRVRVFWGVAFPVDFEKACIHLVSLKTGWRCRWSVVRARDDEILGHPNLSARPIPIQKRTG